MTDGGGDGERAPPTAAAAAVAMHSGSHGVVSPFNGNEEDWIDYAERLENYFVANDIADEAKRRAILLNGVGPSTYRLIKTLCLPRSAKDFKFEELVERVRTHFDPKPPVIVKRFEFNTRKQRSEEPVSEFVAALRKITEYCEYARGHTERYVTRPTRVWNLRQTCSAQVPSRSYFNVRRSQDGISSRVSSQGL